MIGFLYRKIIKPILFKYPADDVHNFFLKTGNYFGRNNFIKKVFGKLFVYKNSILKQKILSLQFENPVGLAAGFDYDADLIDILPSIGFGFHSIGSVTYLPYAGNKAPMLDRLPKSKSLLVNKGFKSMGMESVLKKIGERREDSIPLGISIGSTNMPYKKIEEMADDVHASFDMGIRSKYFDYFELNISCPNLINIENLKEKFDDPIGFSILLNNLSYLNINRPLFIKMHAEKSPEETLALLDIAKDYKWISGVIMSNLVKNRENIDFDKEEVLNAGKGNFSGKPTEELSNNLITEIHKKYKDRFIIIGCGGIFSGKDAYEKIKRGATLVQLITGMVYEGPSVIGKINKDVSKLLKKDGYKNISEAVGVYNK
ncbi:quinone-dependent dihydroorotate dehydrogenase [Candidatus Nomurabacteria bacterium]|nr:quinone-dependent dihydroorotate dehydrogenase [Candidatus Nomurabacteria bacterium]